VDSKRFDGLSRRAAVAGLSALALVGISPAAEAKKKKKRRRHSARCRSNSSSTVVCAECPTCPDPRAPDGPPLTFCDLVAVGTFCQTHGPKCTCQIGTAGRAVCLDDKTGGACPFTR